MSYCEQENRGLSLNERKVLLRVWLASMRFLSCIPLGKTYAAHHMGANTSDVQKQDLTGTVGQIWFYCFLAEEEGYTSVPSVDRGVSPQSPRRWHFLSLFGVMSCSRNSIKLYCVYVYDQVVNSGLCLQQEKNNQQINVLDFYEVFFGKG